MSLSQLPVIDTDSHVSEPPDLWTSRIAEKWRDLVPVVRVERKEGKPYDRWYVGESALIGAGEMAMAGWSDFPPTHPARLEDADPAAWNPVARLERMNEYGVDVQVLYPNLLGFYSQVFVDQIRDGAALEACVRAYNDFLTDFAREDPRRFVPIMALPFWDLDATLNEVVRCERAGHRGILFSNAPEKAGYPALRDEHWAPLWSLAQDLGLSVNFHIGFMQPTDQMKALKSQSTRADYTKNVALAMLHSNAAAIAEVAVSGMCHRYPSLNFVSVESGFGWLPYWMEVLDWEWLASGAAKDNPQMEKPSFYIRRQVFGTCWFETETVKSLLHILPDNVMFETDFPHPTSLSPGPASYAVTPRETVSAMLDGVPLELAEKLLWRNAARVYRLENVTKVARPPSSYEPPTEVCMAPGAQS